MSIIPFLASIIYRTISDYPTIAIYAIIIAFIFLPYTMFIIRLMILQSRIGNQYSNWIIVDYVAFIVFFVLNIIIVW